MQKIILENVIVKGFDPEFVQERMSKNGKPYTKSFVSVQTTDAQKDQIFNALEQNAPYYNANGENVFDKFGKIPAWNELGEKIEQPLNFEFVADVSIMVDFSGGFAKTECLGNSNQRLRTEKKSISGKTKPLRKFSHPTRLITHLLQLLHQYNRHNRNCRNYRNRIQLMIYHFNFSYV